MKPWALRVAWLLVLFLLIEAASHSLIALLILLILSAIFLVFLGFLIFGHSLRPRRESVSVLPSNRPRRRDY